MYLSRREVLRSTKGSDQHLVYIDASSRTSHAHWVGIEILFESEFDPAVKWATWAFDHDALDQPNASTSKGLQEC